MVLSAIPKDYKIIKDDQEQIGHTEWKGHWAFMIPWFYYSWLHGLSSWNTTVLRQATEIYDHSSVASRDAEGSPPDLHMIIFWLCTHMTFLLGARKKWACSSPWCLFSSKVISLSVSELSRSWNWWRSWDHSIDFTLGFYTDQARILKAFHLLSLQEHHDQLPKVPLSDSVITASGEGLSLMAYAVLSMLSTFQRPSYRKVCFPRLVVLGKLTNHGGS